ncbi:acyl carrier protein [Streptomyces sp. NPDC054904]|uniref:acyl carrier protein n=1 Tax=unclassified Streptomyces TaxID=2593676 RepID=UPI002481A04A|nr:MULTISPECIES: acyl carrier protein [unclassified Streptomyces]MDA5284525.1 acyl carrier protein [Streptomyces sp. Isolate_45]MDX2393640.1 acyl carrier protein [Streptomyces sp. DK15]
MTEQLVSSPGSERRSVLEEIVVAEFKAALLMPDDEELPVEAGFFELGMTSLLLTMVKQRLEEQLGRGISSTALFNQPTVERLTDYLASEVLADIFDVN